MKVLLMAFYNPPGNILSLFSSTPSNLGSSSLKIFFFSLKLTKKYVNILKKALNIFYCLLADEFNHTLYRFFLEIFPLFF